MAGQLSDVISHFITMNEINTFVEYGYSEGQFAPGLKLSRGELQKVRHNALLGHGLAVQAIRAKAKPGTKGGLGRKPAADLVDRDVQETHWLAARLLFAILPADAADAQPTDLIAA